MPVIAVDRADDERLAAYTRMTDMELRMASEPAAGMFLAEGEKVIRRALAAGLQPMSALMEPKWWPALEPDLPPPDMLRQITGFRLHRGALAAFARPTPADPAVVLAGVDSAVLLEDLVDHTNVGAVFRSAAGLGIGAVLVTQRCADPWYRRSVKTSMGAVFTLPWATVADAEAGIRAARRAGMRTVALEPQAATSLRDWRRSGPTMLLLGTEGPGLTETARRGVDTSLSIPMHRGVDSLNVAMAATIAFFVLTG
jgi:tRNA G18 (ribose-2'-O)-methylase SpoU